MNDDTARRGRFDTPLWRFTGSAGGWLLFALCFSLLYLGASTVMGLGGYCASGGPYEIETECPEAVVLFVPLSIFGGLAAVGIGAFLSGGFGTPLLSWAWPTLFVGLGIAFLLASTQPGGITFLFVGLMFLVMGAVPLVLEWRVSVQRLFLGERDLAGVRFAVPDSSRVSILGHRFRTRADDGQPIPATARDWALSLGTTAVSVTAGVYLANQLYAAAGG